MVAGSAEADPYDPKKDTMSGGGLSTDLTEESGILAKEPVDKGHFVLITCCMLGVAVLFPWNALITANNFWTYTFGEDSDFEFYLSAVFNWPQWITLLFITKFGPRFSFSSRIITTLVIYAFTLIFIPAVCTIDMNDNLKLFLSLSASFVTGMAASIQFGTILGLASVFPSKYVTAEMSGMGIGGVAIGLLAMFTQATFGNLDNGATLQAWVYFVAAVVIVIITLIMYVFMMRTEYAKFYVDRYNEETRLQQLASTTKGHDMSWYFSIFKKIWIDAGTVWLVFFVSLSLFPGLMLQVQTTFVSQTWYNLIIPLEFNLFDMIGRSIPYVYVLPAKFVAPLAVVRIIFYPLVIFCVNPVLFPDPELWMYAFNAVFAISNGFLGTLAMMYAPGKVAPEEQQTTGIMMSFFLNFGIFCATNFAILLAMI